MMQSEIKPATIFRHAFGVYPPLAMLAGMQLDVFTPLKGGPMTASALADAIGANAARLRSTTPMIGSRARIGLVVGKLPSLMAPRGSRLSAMAQGFNDRDKSGR